MTQTNRVRITLALVNGMKPGDTFHDTELKGFGARCQLKGVSYCGFRRCRPGIPIEAGHLFRSKSATLSGDVGHPSGLVLSCRRG
jgi:hypothetical protein